MEQYLIDEYGVIFDPQWLKSEEDITDYFKGNKDELFACGQGYYQDEVEVLALVGDKFYKVTIHAEILSARQDRGDRLYWVDDIESVEYVEVPKPEPKIKTVVSYCFEMTDDQRQQTEALFRELKLM